MKPIVLLLLAAGLVAGCGPKLDPGAEGVLVTTNPAVVEGAELLGSDGCSVAYRKEKMAYVLAYAKNFTHSKGGDTAFVQMISSAGVLNATVEAYRRPRVTPLESWPSQTVSSERRRQSPDPLQIPATRP